MNQQTEMGFERVSTFSEKQSAVFGRFDASDRSVSYSKQSRCPPSIQRSSSLQVEKMSDSETKESALNLHPIERGIRGRVKWFSIVSGYGFINRRDTNEDVFVHASSIIQNNPRQLHALDADNEVIFDVYEDTKGKRAVAVTGIDGLPVQDTRIIFRRRFNARNPSKRDGAKNRNGAKGIKSFGDSKENSASEIDTPESSDDKANSPNNQRRRRSTKRRFQKKNKKIDGDGELGDLNSVSAIEKQQAEGANTNETVESNKKVLA
ncbi:Y-box-binding protein 2-A-like isoform X3 [Aphelenchoides besseyi]|nr:Y-box-binding protein 2-A-like isoform X3 [Aphelenchoides besseyi]KAI6207438.1 Y-box-binding protein 2-A-like isoform X3 [Aphelenchoides besseyi]